MISAWVFMLKALSSTVRTWLLWAQALVGPVAGEKTASSRNTTLVPFLEHSSSEASMDLSVLEMC